MSHITTMKNNALTNVDRENLKKALAEMNCSLDFENGHIKNSYIEDDCDAALIYNGKRLGVGFNFVTETVDGKEVETLVVSGDFYGTGLDQTRFTNALAQTYQKFRVVDLCAQQGWYVNAEDITVTDNGNIEIFAERYA